MKRFLRLAAVLLVGTGAITGCSSSEGNTMDTQPDYANNYDKERAPIYAEREADWRNGPVVYHVFVDRFAPPEDLEAKKHFYPAPRKLRTWHERPKRGFYLEDAKVWSHEVDFWGGDLKSVASKLDYIEGLGVDVVYLNPIHNAFTNHKYDSLDYFTVSPEYGDREDVKALAEATHARGMKLMLDGVFNHMGRNSDWFQAAMNNPDSPERQWFFIGPQYRIGYRAWADVPNLPELRLEAKSLRDRIWIDADSVVQGYLKDGIDGWRLDVSFDIGFEYLRELTEAAHHAKPGSLVIGENWDYPEEWSPSLDAVMNFHASEIIYQMVRKQISGARASRMVGQMVEDTGLLPILKSWIVLGNHDTPRLKNMLPEKWQQRMAQVLQFSLPGSPCVYYGLEVGMRGGDDPENRGPMRWDMVNDSNQTLKFFHELSAFRENNRALRIGDFRCLDTDKLMAFLRYTDCVDEAVLVVANPTDQEVTESFSTRYSKFINWSMLKNQIGIGEARVFCGIVTVTIPPHDIWLMKADTRRGLEYTPYKRVQ